MNKPNNYDTTRSGGEYTPIVLGGHRAIIKDVKETQSKTGRDMVVVSIDFAAEDAQPKYFEDAYRNDTRDTKKWPYQGVQYILTEDAEGNTSRSFKSFCTSFEESNNTTIKWGGNNWGAQFKNRRIGVVFGEVEEEYNGEIKTRRRIRWFCDDSKAAEQDVPKKQYYKGAKPAPAASSDDWMQIPDTSEDELPFR